MPNSERLMAAGETQQSGRRSFMAHAQRCLGGTAPGLRPEVGGPDTSPCPISWRILAASPFPPPPPASLGSRLHVLVFVYVRLLLGGERRAT